MQLDCWFGLHDAVGEASNAQRGLANVCAQLWLRGFLSDNGGRQGTACLADVASMQ